MFLTVCGLVAAQSPQAPNPVQQSTGNAGGSMPIYRITVEIKPLRLDAEVPLELYEARNAVQIALGVK